MSWDRCNDYLAILKPDIGTWNIYHYYMRGRSGICDLVYCNERYYVVTYESRAASIDHTTLRLKKIIGHYSIMNSSSCPLVKFYLIKITIDELLRVQISSPRDNNPSNIKIFKFVASQSNIQSSMFEELDNLEDEALFFSDYCFMSVLSSKFLGCKANSVYYLDNALIAGNYNTLCIWTSFTFNMAASAPIFP
ncbi:hypothetical protein P3S68_002133 [Capsicum galapagoense]